MTNATTLLTPKVIAILEDKAASNFLKDSLSCWLRHDPVDAVNEVEAMLEALREHLEGVHHTAQ